MLVTVYRNFQEDCTLGGWVTPPLVDGCETCVHSNHLRFPAAFHTRTVPLKHVKFSLVYRLLCSILFFWHISGYGSYHKVYH